MVESGCESVTEHFAESPSPEQFYNWQSLVNSTSERITSSQYKKAKTFFEEALTNKQSPEKVIEGICVLMAESFREGIHLTLETYGLKGG